MAQRYFGTDGIRGTANTHPLTPEVMVRLARAIVSVLDIEEGNVVTIGLDTRVSCVMLEAVLTGTLLSEGVNVCHLGVVSTPITASVTRASKAVAGIMITASHNPYQDNGIKIFTSEGYKLSDEQEHAIEEFLDQESTQNFMESTGVSLNAEQSCDLYFDTLSDVTGDIDFQGMKLVVDCANGSNSFLAVPYLESLGFEVIPMGVEPDGKNINEGCGAVHPERAAELVVKHQADAGVCFDGDGDRLIMIDHQGTVVSGDRLLYIAAIAMQARAELKHETLVATVMSNLGLRDALAEKGISLITTGVGDRLVFQKMRDDGYNLGGENSGHLIFGDQTTTGDGLLSAIRILLEVKRSEKTLYELSCEMKEYPSSLVNIPVSSKPPFNEIAGLSEAIVQVEQELGEEGRILLRYSGTENKLRVLVEAKHQAQVDQYSDQLCEIIRKSL